MTFDQALDSIKRYRERGTDPGHFITAVLCNDLFAAVSRADSESLLVLPQIVKWVHRNLETGIYGSKDKMEAHRSHLRQEHFPF